MADNNEPDDRYDVLKRAFRDALKEHDSELRERALKEAKEAEEKANKAKESVKKRKSLF